MDKYGPTWKKPTEPQDGLFCARYSRRMNTPASHERPSTSRRIARILLVGFTATVILTCLVCGVWFVARYRSELPRTQWKGQALVRLASLSITNDEIRLELDALKASTNHTELGWVPHTACYWTTQFD